MSTVRIVRDVIGANGGRLTTQGIFIDAADLPRYLAYGWRLPLGAPAIPVTDDQYDGFTKAPTDIDSWTFDWSPALAAGETISASSWIGPGGLTVSSAAATSTTTTIWVSGGTLGATYLVTNRIATTAGRQHDWSFRVSIAQT